MTDNGEDPQRRYDDETFEMAGGFSFTDELATGLKARSSDAVRAGQMGVTVSASDILWLAEGYERLRSDIGGGQSDG